MVLRQRNLRRASDDVVARWPRCPNEVDEIKFVDPSTTAMGQIDHEPIITPRWDRNTEARAKNFESRKAIG
jgi:hypothetical protein